MREVREAEYSIASAGFLLKTPSAVENNDCLRGYEALIATINVI